MQSDPQTPLNETSLEFMVRVKLPCASDFKPGDGYESARNDAIFAIKPCGFEVKWPREGQTWPVDSEGYTYVPLFLTYHKDALAFYMERHFKSVKFRNELVEKAEEVARIARCVF